MCSFLLLHICYIVLPKKINVIIKFLSQVIFVMFLGMEMYANEVETKEKENYLN